VDALHALFHNQFGTSTELLLSSPAGYSQLMKRTERAAKRTSAMVKIVYDGTIFTSQASGGISRYFRKLIEEMARIRPEWTFDLHIVEDGREPARLPTGDNIRVTRRKHFRPGWFWLPVNYANRQFKIRSARPTILHTTLARPFSFAPCPLVTTIHDAIIEKLPEFYAHKSHARAKRWWRWSANHADAIFTVSRTSRSDILEIWSPSPSRVHVTYPGVEEAFMQAGSEKAVRVSSKNGVERPYLLYVGHRGEHKNFPVLASAIKDPALQNLDLVLVGGADRVPELEGWSGLERNRLHYLKRVTDSELRSLYSAAAALVFPSLYEGFGFPLVEAMSCGAPVVSSDIPSSREVCGDVAEFFQPRDPADCVKAILRVQDRQRRQTLMSRGIERAKQFNWPSCANETIRIYEELIAVRSPQAARNHAVPRSNSWESHI
jgi:glycosyltransferase involved in cell wall biosynthesis